MAEQKWETTETRITNFKFDSTKLFNMLISDKMYQKLKAISSEDGVRALLGTIVTFGVDGLSKVTTDMKEWKMFQHLIPLEELSEYKRKKRKKQDKPIENTIEEDNKSEKLPKKRKHYHHFVNIEIKREEYNQILELHHRVNTFSMAMIIRILADIFLDLYEKCGDCEEALLKLGETIENMQNGSINCKAEFVVLQEIMEDDASQWRAWGYFQIEYLDKDKNRVYFFRLRL